MIDAVVAGALLLVFDQGSKAAVRRWSGRLRWIRYVENARHPHARRPALLVLSWCAALLAVIVLGRMGGWFETAAARWGLGLAFGGAAGNLIDLLRRSRVADFIELGWWPVFNLADVGIVGGLAAALCL